jgi:HAD superfamily hydrolase (TIGR01509 family)
MLKGIIFDLDGVIVDSHVAHKKAWRGLLASLGRHVSEQELEFVVEGHKREEILRHFMGELREEEVREHSALKDEFFRAVAHEVTVIPGIPELIERASSESVVLAIGTSAARKRAEEMLNGFGLKSHFRVVVTGDDVQRGKPDPAVFQMAAEGMGLSAGNVLVCEDAVPGVQAAKSAGMKCLAVAANGRRALLERAGADAVVEDFREVSVGELRHLFVSPKSFCATPL